MNATPERQAGFTIVETMIFLVVSMVLIVSALLLFNGRLQRTQFRQSIQEVSSIITSVANETGTGTYSSPPFTCIINGTAPQVAASGSPTDTQGANSDCIFLGKVTSLSTSSLDTYVIVGRRQDSSGRQASEVYGSQGANPRLIVDPDNTQAHPLSFGTEVTARYRQKPDGSRQPIAAAVFLQSLTGYDSSTNLLQSGSQRVELWTMDGSSPADKTAAANALRNEEIHPIGDDQIVICLRSGSRQERASITIGQVGEGLNTSILYGDTTCAL